MKILLWLCLLHVNAQALQTFDMSKIRGLYQTAPLIKQDARKLDLLMLKVDAGAAAPVLVCYKGANEMIQAKYAFNPIVKFEKFSKGKDLIQKAVQRDTLDLEMRFLRYSIQSNLPSFLGYHDELDADKRFLLKNTKNNKDPELKGMIFNYLSALAVTKPQELKQLKN